MQIKSAVIAILISASVIGGVAFLFSNEIGTQTEIFNDKSNVVHIGVILPRTGDLSAHGNENWRASELAEQKFNEYLDGEGEDWKIELVLEDSATHPAIAREKLAKLHGQNISIIIGPETSENLYNVKDFASDAESDLVLISCCSTSTSLSGLNDNIFRMVPDDRQQGLALANVLNHFEKKAIITIWRDDLWGTDLNQEISNSFVNNFGGIVISDLSYSPEDPNFSALVPKIEQEIQDVLVSYSQDQIGLVFLGFEEIKPFIQQSQSHDEISSVQWFGPSSLSNTNIGDSSISKFLDDVDFTTVHLGTNGKGCAYDDVKTHLEKQFGSEYTPSNFAYYSYDAVLVAGHALIDSKSDNLPIRDYIPLIEEKEVCSATGSLKFEPYGDLQSADYDILQFDNAKWDLYGEYKHDSDMVEPI